MDTSFALLSVHTNHTKRKTSSDSTQKTPVSPVAQKALKSTSDQSPLSPVRVTSFISSSSSPFPSQPLSFLPYSSAFNNFSINERSFNPPAAPKRQIPLDDYRRNLNKIMDDKQVKIDGVVYTLGDKLGQGDFSIVYRLSSGKVAKFPKGLDFTNSTTIRNNQKNAKEHYKALLQRKEKLDELNMGIAETRFHEEGFITQPESVSFKPSWREKPNTKVEELSLEEQAVLKTAQKAFKFFLEDGLCVDFKPDNLALDPTKLGHLIIRDFYEMRDDTFKMVVEQHLHHWALGNQNIRAYLNPTPSSLLGN